MPKFSYNKNNRVWIQYIYISIYIMKRKIKLKPLFQFPFVPSFNFLFFPMSSRTLVSCIRGPATVSRWLWPYLINYHSPKHAVKLYLRSPLPNLCQSRAHQNSIFWNPLHFLSKKKSNKRLLGTTTSQSFVVLTSAIYITHHYPAYTFQGKRIFTLMIFPFPQRTKPFS